MKKNVYLALSILAVVLTLMTIGITIKGMVKKTIENEQYKKKIEAALDKNELVIILYNNTEKEFYVNLSWVNHPFSDPEKPRTMCSAYLRPGKEVMFTMRLIPLRKLTSWVVDWTHQDKVHVANISTKYGFLIKQKKGILLELFPYAIDCIGCRIDNGPKENMFRIWRTGDSFK